MTFWSQCFHHFVGNLPKKLNQYQTEYWSGDSLCKKKRKIKQKKTWWLYKPGVTRCSISTCWHSLRRGCLSPWLRKACWTDWGSTSCSWSSIHARSCPRSSPRSLLYQNLRGEERRVSYLSLFFHFGCCLSGGRCSDPVWKTNEHLMAGNFHSGVTTLLFTFQSQIVLILWKAGNIVWQYLVDLHSCGYWLVVNILCLLAA